MVGLAEEAINSNSIHPHSHYSFDANEPTAGDGPDEGLPRAHAAARPDRHGYESVQGSRGAPYCVGIVSVVIDDDVNVDGDIVAIVIAGGIAFCLIMVMMKLWCLHRANTLLSRCRRRNTS